MIGSESDAALKGLASRLRVARGGRTLDEIAKFIGCNKASISRYESGQNIPDVAYLLKFSDLTNRSASWLLTGIESDETAFSIKEGHYLSLAKAVSCMIEKEQQENGVRLKWQSCGDVFKMFFQLAIELSREGCIDFGGKDSSVYEDLESRLESHLKQFFKVITKDIFLSKEEKTSPQAS